jgi:hypothetical protein
MAYAGCPTENQLRRMKRVLDRKTETERLNASIARQIKFIVESEAVQKMRRET